MSKGSITAERENDSLDVSAQLKASFKKNTDGTESLQLTGRASADISVIKDGKKRGVQGDHVITHALPKHGILKEFQNLNLDEIEDLSAYLRNRRDGLYNFISAIAALDVDRKGELYGALDQALDDYNQRRIKKSELDHLGTLVNEHIPEESRKYFYDNFQRQLDSNGRTMIDSVGRIAEAVMTFYNKTPLTAFLQIEGFEDAAGSGGKVNSVLEFLDNLDASKDRFSTTYLEEERKLVNSAQAKQNATSLRSSARVSQANDATLEQAQKALAEKEQSLDEAFLHHSMQQLSGLIFYPEITAPEALLRHAAQSGNKERIRDNSPENLAAAIAKYVHVLSATYPELPEKLFDLHNTGKTWDESRGSKKDEALTFVTRIFTQHLIASPYQSKSGQHAQGWPTFAHDAVKIREIGDNATVLVHHYKALQEEHSYQKTDGFRSRASSTTIEDLNKQTINSVVEFIGENFGLEEEVFEGLVKQLNELDLSGKSDEKFKSEVIKKVKIFREDYDIEEKQFEELKELLLPSKAKVAEVRR